VNITSAVAYGDPTAPAGSGGWGLGYAMSKGAFHRIAGILAVELGDRGVRAWNVQPGFIATERIAMDMAQFGFDAAAGAPPDVVAAVVAWLLRGEHDVANGANIEAQEVCTELGLLPGWPGPRERGPQ
jgi:NAD(P)-dependent dehydrogenase (short-subunit alcohol dehydrogenase family)